MTNDEYLKLVKRLQSEGLVKLREAARLGERHGIFIKPQSFDALKRAARKTCNGVWLENIRQGRCRYTSLAALTRWMVAQQQGDS